MKLFLSLIEVSAMNDIKKVIKIDNMAIKPYFSKKKFINLSSNRSNSINCYERLTDGIVPDIFLSDVVSDISILGIRIKWT